MKKIFLALALLSMMVMVLVPMIVSAKISSEVTLGGGGADPTTQATQGCKSLETGGLRDVANCVIGFFDIAIVIMISAAFLFVVYGAFIMLSSEEKREAGKQTIYYGIIGIFVMVSVWGLVNILKSTFSLTNTPVTPPTLLKVS